MISRGIRRLRRPTQRLRVSCRLFAMVTSKPLGNWRAKIQKSETEKALEAQRPMQAVLYGDSESVRFLLERGGATLGANTFNGNQSVTGNVSATARSARRARSAVRARASRAM